MSIGVILNGFKRPETLALQLDAVKNNSVNPSEIMFWRNHSEHQNSFNVSSEEFDSCFYSTTNMGVWARFYAALNLRTEYVAIFDDDTIPGSRWFENCLFHIKKNPGLYGTIGLVFDNNENYFHRTRHGWQDANEDLKQVDMVGHAWFFKREWLHLMCDEIPRTNFSGEDMYLSYVLQKKGIPTYVPPHPKWDKKLWGSLEPMRGCDSVALSNTSCNEYQIDFRILVDKGWKLLCQKEDTNV